MLEKSTHWQPELHDELVTLRPLKKFDFDDLFHIVSDPGTDGKDQTFSRNRFQIHFDEAIASKKSLVILNKSDLKTIGYTTYGDYSLKNSKVSIGRICLPDAGSYTYYVSTKKLLLKHAFQFVDHVHFYIGIKSTVPEAELLKIGAKKIKEFNPAKGAKNYPQSEYVVTKTTWLHLSRPVL